MDPYFTELGKTVYARWKAVDFSLEAFPAIAAKALGEKPPVRHADLGKLIVDFLLNDEQPYQSSSGFGQPELILHDNPRFYIQALFWMDGTTDIHQHGFSGAFHVMAGSSLHARYDFLKPRAVTARFRTGGLKLRETALLPTGTTVPIASGSGCIHSLFHLETPSVTIVVRTHSDPGTDPQFTYLPPHVALDPIQDDTLTLRRKQLLDVLEQTGDPSYPELVLRLIGELDLERGFFILQNGIGHLRSLGVWETVWKAFVKKHGAKARPLLPVLEEIVRRDAIVAMRATVIDPDLRFFLALLLNIPDRKQILEMISKRHKGEPLNVIQEWALELLRQDEETCWILDARFPEEVSMAEDEQPGLLLAALAYFIQGGRFPRELQGLSKRDLAALEKAFISSSWKILGMPSGKARG
jgi:hypothetical protein